MNIKKQFDSGIFVHALGCQHYCMEMCMDELQLTGQNLGRVFHFRSGHLRALQFWRYQ
jgi:hypothetical protein